MSWRSGDLVCSRLVLWDGWSWSLSFMLYEVVLFLVGIDYLSCEALPVNASKGLRADGAEVFR